MDSDYAPFAVAWATMCNAISFISLAGLGLRGFLRFFDFFLPCHYYTPISQALKALGGRAECSRVGVPLLFTFSSSMFGVLHLDPWRIYGEKTIKTKEASKERH
jgi:hypothetical protein